MQEIKKALGELKKDNEKLLKESKEAMSKAREQWYKNDLTLQNMIAETRIEMVDMMLKLIVELEQGQTRPVEKKSFKVDEGVVDESEDEIFNRFRSR